MPGVRLRSVEVLGHSLASKKKRKKDGEMEERNKGGRDEGEQKKHED